MNTSEQAAYSTELACFVLPHFGLCQSITQMELSSRCFRVAGETDVGIPSGIGRLFMGYSQQAGEAVDATDADVAMVFATDHVYWTESIAAAASNHVTESTG